MITAVISRSYRFNYLNRILPRKIQIIVRYLDNRIGNAVQGYKYYFADLSVAEEDLNPHQIIRQAVHKNVQYFNVEQSQSCRLEHPEGFKRSAPAFVNSFGRHCVIYVGDGNDS